MTYSSLLSMVFLFSAILMRPTLFGLTATSAGLILMVFVSTIFVVARRLVFQVQKSEFWMIALTAWIIVFWLYCLTFALISGNSNNDIVARTVIPGIITSLAFLLFLSDRNINQYIFHKFAIFNSLLGWSIIASQILLFFLGYDLLVYGKIPIENYENITINGDLIFPFSIIYASLSEYGIYRFLGIYNEPGMGQLFFAWSAIYLFFLKEKKILIIGSLLGGLFMVSTAYFLSATVALFGYLILDKKIQLKYVLLITPLVAFFVMAAIYSPGFGLLDKSSTHSTSIESRFITMRFTFSDIEGYLFGNGLSYKYSPYNNMGINLLSSIYYIGIVGACIYLSTFFIRHLFGGRKQLSRYTILTLPLLVTSATSQPLISAPLAYMLLYCIPPTPKALKSEKLPVS